MSENALRDTYELIISAFSWLKTCVIQEERRRATNPVNMYSKLVKRWCNYATRRYLRRVRVNIERGGGAKPRSTERHTRICRGERRKADARASTYDIKNVERCQSIFRARKAAAHLRLRSSVRCPRRISTATAVDSRRRRFATQRVKLSTAVSSVRGGDTRKGDACHARKRNSFTRIRANFPA